MTAQILDGRLIAQTLKADLRKKTEVLYSKRVIPVLAVILVGDDPASQIYVRNKTKACAEVGISAIDVRFPSDIKEEILLAKIQELNLDPKVHGILIQLPLPKGLHTDKILKALDPRKDVDGLLPYNVGSLWMGKAELVPCTPLGILHLLQVANVKLEGAQAVIVGRSHLVGRPMAALLLSQDATVTICHSKTKDLEHIISNADIVIAALGKPEFIRGSWIRHGATVIDVGINRRSDGSIVGDVEFVEAEKRAGMMTKVPGGVGPMTIAMLLHNTIVIAEKISGV